MTALRRQHSAHASPAAAAAAALCALARLAAAAATVGRVHRLSPSMLCLLVLGGINASIPRAQLPAGFKYDKAVRVLLGACLLPAASMHVFGLRV